MGQGPITPERDFHCVPADDFSKWVVLWEVFVNQFQKLFTNIGTHISRKGGVKPGYFPLSLWFLILVGNGWVKLKGEVVSTFVEGILVRGPCQIEDLLIG